MMYPRRTQSQIIRVIDLETTGSPPPVHGVCEVGWQDVALGADGRWELQGEGGNMLGVLHSLGYTRGLLNALHFPERKRLQSMVKYAILGLLADDMRAKALREGTRALPLTTRAQHVRGLSWTG